LLGLLALGSITPVDPLIDKPDGDAVNVPPEVPLKVGVAVVSVEQ
jgi:hypothetical protein